VPQEEIDELRAWIAGRLRLFVGDGALATFDALVAENEQLHFDKQQLEAEAEQLQKDKQRLDFLLEASAHIGALPGLVPGGCEIDYYVRVRGARYFAASHREAIDLAMGAGK
ncbi:MAG: hypothetical protein KC492_39800, partial [Myxococcales bacterium]|nr:hypothetical protein [Myxococcales bacterium]